MQRPCSWILRPTWQKRSQGRRGVRAEVHGVRRGHVKRAFQTLVGCSRFTLKARGPWALWPGRVLTRSMAHPLADPGAQGGTHLDTRVHLSSGCSHNIRAEEGPAVRAARSMERAGPFCSFRAVSSWALHLRSPAAPPLSVFLSRDSLPCTIVPEHVAQARAILPSALNPASSQSHLVSSACSVNPPPPHPCPEKTIHRLTRAHSPTG